MTVARSTLLIKTPQVAIPLGMFPLGRCPDEKLDHFVANDHVPNCFGANANKANGISRDNGSSSRGYRCVESLRQKAVDSPYRYHT